MQWKKGAKFTWLIHFIQLLSFEIIVKYFNLKTATKL